MKGCKKIMVVILAFIILIYLLILFNTNTVIEDFKNCIRGENISQELMSTELYQYFDDFNGRITDVDVNVTRWFVLHNFHKGVMYIKYSYEAFDKNGNHIKGASNVFAKWYILKINDMWEVIKIEEEP